MHLIRPTLRLLAHPVQRKHLLAWMASHRSNYCLTTSRPWLPFDLIAYLDALNLSGKRVFEYGSGGSTRYWLRRGMYCVSIEHDRTWYHQVSAYTHTEEQLDYRFIQPEVAQTELFDPADPHLYLSADPLFRGYSFKNYVTQIETFPDDYFDLILIDGRARPACLMHSVNKVALGGQILLDNADRDYYLAQTEPLLQHFARHTFYGATPAAADFTTTAIFTRLR